MVSLKLRERGWYVNASGTRYIRDKAKAKLPKEKLTDPSPQLAPFLNGEAEGDFHLAVILAVRDLISTPERYVKHTRACGRNGQPAEPTSSDAVRWSIFGAVEFFTQTVPRVERTKVLSMIKLHLPTDHRMRLSTWEEDRYTTHSQVIGVLNTAVGEYQMTKDGPRFAR